MSPAHPGRTTGAAPTAGRAHAEVQRRMSEAGEPAWTSAAPDT